MSSTTSFSSSRVSSLPTTPIRAVGPDVPLPSKDVTSLDDLIVFEDLSVEDDGEQDEDEIQIITKPLRIGSKLAHDKNGTALTGSGYLVAAVRNLRDAEPMTPLPSSSIVHRPRPVSKLPVMAFRRKERPSAGRSQAQLPSLPPVIPALPPVSPFIKSDVATQLRRKSAWAEGVDRAARE